MINREENVCPCCGQSHLLIACNKFFNLINVDERFEVIRKNGLCFRCLRFGHIGRYCTLERVTCGVDNSKGVHHRLLHGVPPGRPD